MAKRIFLWLTVLTLVCPVIAASGCSPNTTLTEPITASSYKLNTYVTISCYSNVDQQIIWDALNLCDQYEHIFSRTLKDSELSMVNSGQKNDISHELGELIEKGLEYSRLSQGSFDITIGSVSMLWDFTAETPTVPDESAILNALQYVDYTKVNLDKNADGTYHIEMPKGTCIDLGAIAKGYIADRIKEYLLAQHIDHAVINLGGNVLCVGQKRDGTDFNIGIKQPFGKDNELMLNLSINDISVVSSGTYERCFYENNIFYHHILNPDNGYPYNNHLWDVTILSGDSVTGDCLSTTCFSLGLEDGMALIESIENVEAVFMTDDGIKHFSSGIQKYII